MIMTVMMIKTLVMMMMRIMLVMSKSDLIVC